MWYDLLNYAQIIPVQFLAMQARSQKLLLGGSFGQNVDLFGKIVDLFYKIVDPFKWNEGCF